MLVIQNKWRKLAVGGPAARTIGTVRANLEGQDFLEGGQLVYMVTPKSNCNKGLIMPLSA